MRSCSDGSSISFSRRANSARLASICFNSSSRDSDCAKTAPDKVQSMATTRVAVNIAFISFAPSTRQILKVRNQGASLELSTTWSDPGLSRNTRCCCYRCSVPGLAGFTKRALCGARDLISHCRLPIADLQPELHDRLSVREHSQQSVDAQVQQDVNDDRDHQRQHQGVAVSSGRARDDAAKRLVKRICHGDN